MLGTVPWAKRCNALWAIFALKAYAAGVPILCGGYIKYIKASKEGGAMSEDGAQRGMPAPEGAQEWLTQMQQLSEQIQKQQQNTQQMMQELMNTYMQLLNTPHSYLQEGMRLAQQDTPGTPRGR